MTLQSELSVTQETQATTAKSSTPRGGSYVSLPAGREVPLRRVEGNYV